MKKPYGVEYPEVFHRDTMDMWCAECEKIHRYNVISQEKKKPSDQHFDGLPGGKE